MAEAEGKTHREDLMKFSCPECGRGFDKAQGLALHRNRAHGVKASNGETNGHPDQEGMADKGSPPVQTFVDEVLEYEVDAVLDKLVDDSYVATVDDFLPKLAAEIRKREDEGFRDGDLMKAFFLLYTDVHASA